MLKKKLQLICLLLITLNIGFAFGNSENPSKTTTPQKNITTNDINMEDKNTVKNWKSLTVQALQEMHNHLKENCAGGYDLENEPWQYWLYEGYKQALNMAERVNTETEYSAVLDYYAAGFKDGHIRAGSNLPTKAFWPGFTAYYNSNDFYINSKQKINNNVPANAKVISIDGQPVKEWFTDNVFKFIGNADLQASWHNNAHRLFLDYENPFVKRPVYCELESEGKKLSINLNWQPIAKDNLSSLIKVNKPEYKFSIESFGKNGAWVTLPTFYPQTTEELSFLQNITAENSTLTGYSTIVFDVRGNNGGDSAWGASIVKLLYGEEMLYKIYKQYFKKSVSFFRATAFNLKRYESFAKRQKEHFSKSDTEETYCNQRVKRLTKAIELGDIWCKADESENGEDDFIPKKYVGTKIKRKIYLLVDSYCFSACLDFTDLINVLPNATIVGQETDADTIYMENNSAKLPGGAYLNFPMKIIKNRNRASNQTYIPNYIYKGDIRNTKAVKQWMHELIKDNKTQ